MGVSASDIARVIDSVPKDLLIGGKAISTEKRVPVEDPSTGETLAEVADASPELGLEALGAAAEAQAGWAATDPRERGEILRRGFELISKSRRRRPADDPRDGQATSRGSYRGQLRCGVPALVSEEAVRIAGRYSIAPSGAPPADDEATCRAGYAITLELPRWLWVPARSAGAGRGCTVVIKPAHDTADHPGAGGNLAEAGVPDGCST
jgi:succinate-semialdehyde dehydrogenase/glutarate-semialdehyde dehydrogenase